ncbi:unnamed protein product [Adineta steineri]|uniref:G-protein coupled receptors family 1 profile domain-containing protein n=1 Tax=Adineta steineri TaxID=433720 RepID=A0A814A8K0_9BILA|nr:unnamed protein product [Adineta steineri]CAF0840020.1 unnamed protein product [Adineta steineri]CAF0909509.1 unnamed protein product [Adineta steineri]
MPINTTNLIAYLQNASTQSNRYISIFIFIFGVLGNILNCIVLSQGKLRTNSCSFLFLISSIASLISILSGLTSRMLAGYAVDLTNTISWLCKLRAFVLFVSRTIAAWSLTLASIDRWFSSSANSEYRKKSSLKNSYRNMYIIILFSFMLYIQLFYCYEANLINTPLKCYAKTVACRLASDLSYAIITIIIPIMGMILFGLLTILNVQKSYRRVCIVTVTKVTKNVQNQRKRWKKADYHLLLMLIVQIILYSIFTLPQAIQKIYSTSTETQIKSALQNAIENLIFNLLLLLTYFSSGMPFYIYTLCGGQIFRKALIDVIRKLCICRR